MITTYLKYAFLFVIVQAVFLLILDNKLKVKISKAYIKILLILDSNLMEKFQMLISISFL